MFGVVEILSTLKGVFEFRYQHQLAVHVTIAWSFCTAATLVGHLVVLL